LLQTGKEQERKFLGFGGCFNELGWDALSVLSEADLNIVFAELFSPGKALSFELCRIPIGASDFARDWYSCNETASDFAMENFTVDRDKEALIPFIREAQKRQPTLKFFASPWSPPIWLKTPPIYNGGSLKQEPEVLKAYALYFLKFVRAYKNEGIPIDQVHVQNEPVSAQLFPSCLMSGEEMKRFVRDYLGPLFKKEGVDTEIWLGTLNGPETDKRFISTSFNHYLNHILEDKKVREYVTGASYQWAGKYAVQRTRLAYPELPIMQTENECGDGLNSWEYASYVFDLFYHYLTNDVCAYIYWNMILAEDGKSTWGWKQNSLYTVNLATGQLTRTHEFYLMRHFSDFIHAGARRVELSGPFSGNSIAYRCNGKLVLVIRNPFNREKCISVRDSSVAYSAILPADSFNTLVI
jgi:glucosylceramidase